MPWPRPSRKPRTSSERSGLAIFWFCLVLQVRNVMTVGLFSFFFSTIFSKHIFTKVRMIVLYRYAIHLNSKQLYVLYFLIFYICIRRSWQNFLSLWFPVWLEWSTLIIFILETIYSISVNTKRIKKYGYNCNSSYIDFKIGCLINSLKSNPKYAYLS